LKYQFDNDLRYIELRAGVGDLVDNNNSVLSNPSEEMAMTINEQVPESL
jgi:hypothetical protein